MVPLKSNQSAMRGETAETEGLDIAVERKPIQEEEEGSESESEKEIGEDGRALQIPMHRWVMHGAVMFGREFCYAMETALVTPVLLQIGKEKWSYTSLYYLCY